MRSIRNGLSACLLGVILSMALAGGASAAPAKGSPLVIGTICSCSGPLGSGQAGIKPMSSAWVKWTNAHGGVNGHPVKLVFKDDKGDATAAAAAARALVSQKVLAIVGNFSFQESAWAKIAKDAGIPVVGTPGLSPDEYTNAGFFPIGANATSNLYQGLTSTKKAGAAKLAIMYCTEVPTCGQLKAVMGAFLKTIGGGVSVVSSSNVTASQPSFAAQCLASKNSGANGTFIIDQSIVTTRIMRECVQQGWTPTLFGANGSVPHNDPAAFAKSKVVLTLPTLGIDDRSTAGGKLFHQVLAKYAPNLSSSANYSENLGSVFSGLQLFAKAASTAKLKPASTTSQLKNGLYALKNETLGGLTGPLTFKRGQPTFNGCAFYSSYTGTKWVADTKPYCMTPARVQLLLKNLGGG